MHLRTPHGEFNLRLLHATPPQNPAEPDLHVEVSAKIGQYSAQDVRAWLEWPDVGAFMRELEVLVRDVRGEAKIRAMTPEDLELTVASLDSTGHFGVTFAVSSRIFARGGNFQCGLRGWLELELCQVEEMLGWFRAAVTSGTDA